MIERAGRMIPFEEVDDYIGHPPAAGKRKIFSYHKVLMIISVGTSRYLFGV